MRRIVMLLVLAVGTLTFAAASVADPGDNGKGKKQGKNRFTFTLSTTDNGSCGSPWANDVLRRTYSVKDNGDGTFTFRRTDRGTFTTIAGVSPGKCNTRGKHGQTVAAGVNGKIVGFLEGTVTATSFNPKATCVAACFTDTFLSTFFSAGAHFSCDTNSTDCKFNFNYTANASQSVQKKLKYRHWQDKGKGAGTMLHEVFIGDIATS